DRCFVNVQNHRVDKIRLKDADEDPRVSARRIPRTRGHASSFGSLQPDSQVAGCQQSISVFRIDQGRERTIAGSPSRFNGLTLNLPSVTVCVSHEDVTKSNDLLPTPNVLTEKLGCGLQSCAMPCRGVSQIHLVLAQGVEGEPRGFRLTQGIGSE